MTLAMFGIVILSKPGIIPSLGFSELPQRQQAELLTMPLGEAVPELTEEDGKILARHGWKTGFDLIKDTRNVTSLKAKPGKGLLAPLSNQGRAALVNFAQYLGRTLPLEVLGLPRKIVLDLSRVGLFVPVQMKEISRGELVLKQRQQRANLVLIEMIGEMDKVGKIAPFKKLAPSEAESQGIDSLPFPQDVIKDLQDSGILTVGDLVQFFDDNGLFKSDEERGDARAANRILQERIGRPSRFAVFIRRTGLPTNIPIIEELRARGFSFHSTRREVNDPSSESGMIGLGVVHLLSMALVLPLLKVAALPLVALIAILPTLMSSSRRSFSFKITTAA